MTSPAPALFLAPAAAVSAGRALAQVAAPDDAAQGKLIVVELFFLIVGLAILLALGFLIWQALRRKKEKEKKANR